MQAIDGRMHVLGSVQGVRRACIPFLCKKQAQPVNENVYIKAYPNPAQSFTNILFNYHKAGVKYNLVVTNLKGQTILNKAGTTIKGENSAQLEMGSYSNAMYIVKLITAEDTRTIKLYKEK